VLDRAQTRDALELRDAIRRESKLHFDFFGHAAL
jgi:hypothetical protein